jgi:hypothetical protein
MSDHVDCDTEGNSRRPTRKNPGEEPTGELDPLSLYLRQISKYPLLDAEQEKELGAKLDALVTSTQNPDAELAEELRTTRELLITSNLRLQALHPDSAWIGRASCRERV